MKKTLSIFLAVLFLFVFSTSNVFAAAHSWTERQPGDTANPQSWGAVASDADGSNLAVAVSNGRLYTSADGGATWIERAPVGLNNFAWNSIASDADGSNLFVSRGARLHVSTDGGVSWNETQPLGDVNSNYQDVASDDDGTNLIVADFGEVSLVYTSTNGGDTWTSHDPSSSGSASFVKVASDADGSNLMAGAFSGRLYTSTTSGATWVERQPAGNVNRDWGSLASDADGTNLIVGVASAANGRLYTSTTSGMTWVEQRPAGDTNVVWVDVASDADGSNLMAYDSTNGVLYTSEDGGETWAEESILGQFGGHLASDDDGSNLIAAGYSNGRLYTSPDNVGSVIASFSPEDGAIEVAVDATFDIVFNESVATSTGDIVLKKTSDDSTVETIDVTSALVSIAGDTLTINPSVTLDLATGYYFLVDAGALEDLSGNAFAGIADSTTWNFTADTPPTISTLGPADGETEVSRTGNTFQIRFNQNVVTASGNITLKKSSDNSIVETFDVTDTNVVESSGVDVYLYSSATLDFGTDYYFLIDAGAIEDESGNAFAGITEATTWNFRADTVPAVSGLSPIDNTVGVALDANLVLTFNQEIYIRAFDDDGPNGTVSIIRSNGGTVLETIPLYDVDTEDVDERISGAETAVITINPSSDLEYGKAYHVLVSTDAFRDDQGNEFAGITDDTVWNFQTVAASVASNGTVSSSGRKSDRSDGEQADYDSLLAQLRVLVEQFIALGGTPSPAMLSLLGGGESDYTRDLDLGMEGDDVLMLQNFLIAQNKGPAAQALAAHGVTDYFGPLTQAALAEFQASVGITPAVGYFGPVTRAYINSL